MLWNALMLLVPLPLLWFGRQYFPELLATEIIRAIVVVFMSIYYLMVWLLFFTSFIDLYLDVWIITNKRIVNIEQKGLFSRVESEHQLDVIQDITTEVHGIGPTLFNFGDLLVQTAGENQRVVFKQIPEPYYVKKIISDLVENNKQKERERFLTKK